MSDTSDSIDWAAKTADEERERRIAAVRRELSAKPAPLPTECLNCGEAPKERSAFCDPDCRTDYERRQRQMKRAGQR